MPSPTEDSPATLHRAPWGTTSAGQPLELFTLAEGPISISISNLGATLVSLLAPARDGSLADIVLGYNKPADYEADQKSYFGATVGRFANRIAAGTFSLDGHTHTIPRNNGQNALHGGPEGFNRQVWQACALANAVELTLISPDGDMGFPGTLTVTVRYTLAHSALTIDYTATTTATTTLNLTNHSYFNLAGESSGTILNHLLRLDADRYTPLTPDLIPTGQLAPVAGTPFDFRHPMAIGTHIAAPDPQLLIARGYDHNFVLNGHPDSLHLAAEAHDPSSGRTLRVDTTQPGVQFYSGNFLDGEFTGKSGRPYLQHAGFCLETQHFPDSPNQPQFPTTTLHPGETFRSTTILTLSNQP